jgi:hypothetical protein
MAPLEFVMLEIFVAVALMLKVTVMMISSPCGKGPMKAFNRGLDRFFELFFGFDRN